MWLFCRSGSTQYFIPYSEHSFRTEKFRNNTIRINDNEGWADEGEYFAGLISLYEIVQYFGLVEDIHVAHIIIDLAIRHEESSGVGDFNFNWSTLCKRLVLHCIGTDWP